eukprot:3015336-Pyramimonas_sp.AAC.1
MESTAWVVSGSKGPEGSGARGRRTTARQHFISGEAVRVILLSGECLEALLQGLEAPLKCSGPLAACA